MIDKINSLKRQILNGKLITYEEALDLVYIEINDENNLNELFKAANEIRKKFMGSKADLCTIMNAKSGKCSEDCRFCAQSGYYNTGVEEYSLLSYKDILKRAKEMEEKGVHRFSLVTSGRGVKGEEFDKVVEIYRRLKKDTNLSLCASLGIIDYEQAKKLKEAGVEMYHHNVETSKDNYKNICTTHTYEDRIETIKNVQKSEMDLCVGGILGLDESKEQRLKMAFEIRKLNIKSIPLNILNPIKNTPMENCKKLEPLEILKTMAVYRFVNPSAYIR